MKVLILDDDVDYLTAVKKMLATLNHEAVTSTRAEEAMQLVHQHHFDLVLVDYKMPDHDGIWFMKNVKLPQGTKAFLTTAFVNRELINKMFSLGAIGYIIKPFDMDDLERHLEFFGTTRKTRKPAATTSPGVSA